MLRRLKKWLDFWSVESSPARLQSVGSSPNVLEAMPNRNSYWVKPGALMAGEYPGCPSSSEAEIRITKCLDAGITFFVDLTEEGEIDSYAEILSGLAKRRGIRCEQRRFPIVDRCTPTSDKLMREILDEVARAIEAGHLVYVHCLGGVGRTGTVVGCWFVEQGLSGSKALETINALWARTAMAQLGAHKRTPTTDEQVAWIEGWSADKGKALS
jgi:hypothetical protein